MKNAFIFIYFSLLFFIALYGIHLYWMIIVYLKNRKRKLLPESGNLGFTEFPKVTVQLPIYNEKRVAVRLIEAVIKINWPNDKLDVQILDDSTDETCELIKVFLDKLQGMNNLPNISYLHRDNRKGFKAGALDAGFKRSNSEYIAVFDADNLPDSDFLTANIPFFNDPSIGMIQTRWGFLNQNESLLCRAQALFLNAHFIIEQQARFWGKMLFNFNGTAGIWRSKAIIDAGGWQFDTLTEDLDLSLRAQLAGWKFVYNNSYIVPTELPNRISAFKSQQFRWSKGAVQTGIKLLPSIFYSNLKWYVKLASFFHLSSKTISIALLFLSMLLVPALYIRLESGPVKLFFIDLPIFIAGTGSMSIFYSLAYRYSNKERSIKDIFLLPALTSLGIALAVNNSRALLSAIFNRKSEFIRTPKSGSTEINFRKVPKKYLGIRDNTVYIETFLAAYSLTALFVAIKMNLLFTVPFLLTFFLGYLYFSVKGLKEQYE